MPKASLVDLPYQRAVTQHSIDADFFGVSSLADAVYNLTSLTPVHPDPSKVDHAFCSPLFAYVQMPVYGGPFGLNPSMASALIFHGQYESILPYDPQLT